MSRLAPALLRSVVHLEAVAVLLVEVGEVGNGGRVLGSGGGRRAHSSGGRVSGAVGAEGLLCRGWSVEWRSKGTG